MVWSVLVSVNVGCIMILKLDDGLLDLELMALLMSVSNPPIS